jgi:hypothetical protein
LNKTIYSYATKLLNAFQDNGQKLPIKINFYLQKNKNLLIELGKDIEKARLEVAKQYGTLNPDDKETYIISPENTNIVLKELDDLYNLEQDVPIYKIKLSDFSEDLNLTTAQMDAIMFMIDDE